MGSPAKVIKTLSEEQQAGLLMSAEIYVKNFKRVQGRDACRSEKLKPGSVLINSESPTMFRTALLFLTILACSCTTDSNTHAAGNRQSATVQCHSCGTIWSG